MIGRKNNPQGKNQYSKSGGMNILGRLRKAFQPTITTTVAKGKTYDTTRRTRR